MYRILIFIVLMVSLAISCADKIISDPPEDNQIDVSYLPDILWKKKIGSDSFIEVDTVYARSKERTPIRVELFYDNENGFRPVRLSTTIKANFIIAGGGLLLDGNYFIKELTTSASERYIFDIFLIPERHYLIGVDFIVYEYQNKNKMERKRKRLYVCNPDSL